MAYPLRLAEADKITYMTGLTQAHTIRVRTDILDMDHNLMGRTTGRVLSGQVDVDTSQAITRSCALTVLDPDHLLNLDSSATFGGSLFLDRMVRISYGVKSAGLDWVDVPIFTGPISDLRRDGDVVTLAARGKEVLLLGPASTHRTWKAGSYKTSVLADVLAMFGERFTDISHMSTKTTKPISLAPTTIPWDLVQSIARSWGSGRVVYDGAGYARFQTPNNAPQWTFRGGTGGTLLSKPRVAYDITDVRNFVVVTGATPTKGGKAVVGLAHAPSAHPLSADSLGRGGVRRYLREDIQDNTITTQAAANARAQQELESRLNTGLQLDFTGMVIPFLEPHDVVAVEHGAWSTSSALTTYTIPLTANGTMSIGRRYTVQRNYRERNVARKGPRR